MAAVAAERASSEIAAAASGCACCAPRPAENVTAKSSDVPGGCPEEDCDCSNCICYGAILQCDGDLLHTAPDEVSYDLIPLVRNTDAAQCVVVGQATHSSINGHLLNGRAARIAHQSLLI